MTTFDPSDDELVSAYLDGEGTTEEAAVVASRPDLVARTEDFRAVQEALGAPIPADSAEPSMDDMIGAALGEFDQGSDHDAEVRELPADRRRAGGSVEAAAGPVAAAATSSQPRSGVADLHAARERRNRRNRWLLSAAAVVLAAVTIPAAISGLTSGGEDSSSSADMALETASVEDAGSDSAGAAASDSAEAAVDLEREASDSADAAGGADDDDGGAVDASDAKAAFADEAEEDSDDAMLDTDDAASVTTSAPAAATATDAASADPAEEAMLDEERATGIAGQSAGADSLFFIATDLDELVTSLREPGVLEELAAVADEFGAPTVECAGPGEKGGLARLDDSGMIVEVILAAPDQEPATRIVDQQTCAVLTTVDP